MRRGREIGVTLGKREGQMDYSGRILVLCGRCDMMK